MADPHQMILTTQACMAAGHYLVSDQIPVIAGWFGVLQAKLGVHDFLDVVHKMNPDVNMFDVRNIVFACLGKDT